MKACDVCGKSIEFWENVGWVHIAGVMASGRDMTGHRAIPVDDECEHGVVVKDFGDCDQCVRSLQGDLDDLERTDPAVAKAAKDLDNAVRKVLRRP